MEDKANRAILDRQKAKEDAAKFGAYLDLLREIVDYGTDLVLRAYFTSKKGLSDAIISVFFLKQGVTFIDSIEILLSQGTVSGAIVPTRSLFEITLLINWILQTDTEKRVRQFYVSHLRQQREWAQKLILGTKEKEAFDKIMDAYPSVRAKISNDIREIAKKQKAAIDRILSQPEFTQINQEFDRLRKEKRYDPPWYQPWGVNSLMEMAQRLGRAADYRVFYGSFSETAHGMDLKRHLQFRKGKIVFEPIRNLDEIDTILRYTLNLALGLYSKVLEYFRPEEITNFRRKYLKEWQERFRSIPKVKYKVEERLLG